MEGHGHASPRQRAGDDSPSSPKRKKVRAKYAPKACVSCRRSKLKCSGENPCQRCLDNGKRCFYSEDQTAAEALQNLSRPTPVPPLLNASSANGNSNGLSRRNLLSRHESIERRASDASVRGLSMEARMARIEGMMESLVQDRAGNMTPGGSMEREDTASDYYQADGALHVPVDMFHANLSSSKNHFSFPHESPDHARPSLSAASPLNSAELHTLQLDEQTLPFPSPLEYQKYVDFFFANINPYTPCVNEAEYRARNERMLLASVVHASEASFLALNYIMFACSDFLADMAPPDTQSKPPGWQWLELADEIIGKRTVRGQGDLCLLQCLIYEASYLTYADKPNAAYNVIGLACRLVFQFSLHRQSSWRGCSPFQVHMRQRIFWTVYVADRHIALSCARPYGLRDSDIDVGQPAFIYDKNLLPGESLPEPDLSRSANMYLSHMIYCGKIMGDMWDQVFAAAVEHEVDDEHAVALHARIMYWSETVSPTISLLPLDRVLEAQLLWQSIVMRTRRNQLLLLLRRRSMVSLDYDAPTGRLCGGLAMNTIKCIKAHFAEAKHPGPHRFHITTALGGAVLTLSALLLRDLAPIGLHDNLEAYIEAFGDALTMLHDLALCLQIARRVMDDFKDIVSLVGNVLSPNQVNVAQLVPADIRVLLPYTALSSAHQGVLDDGADGAMEAGDSADVAAAHPRDFEHGARAAWWGVPWI
ncbi:fungal-specific transcription factor domain-containing protein [Massariosphaeria phaeospora]|uniref:Fungal-specific transcription factor domain-containing protein n=1 Tax=Massariosphaeria phaeospora TaxID=100035 RepID=A0A7C8M8L2_9PLEO|nr:fungal-specific transcription factor domain-containing protein [Massariosphaeria phaeospora]